MLRLSRAVTHLGGDIFSRARPWLAAVSAFLVRYRIRLSLFLFVALFVEDVLTGFKPHDISNFFDPYTVFGVGLLLFGLALRSWAAGVLHKLGEVTTSGPYKLIRHPLYLGSLAMMVGVCLLIDDYENLFIMLGFVLIVYVPQVLSEERILAERFSAAWAAYAASTGRFIPRRIWCDVSSNWQFSQWMKNREYNALGATLVGLVLLKVWTSLATS